jgi:hypothetical protein
LVIGSSPQQCASTFFASNVTVFSRKRHLCHESSTVLSDLAPADFWLFPKLKSVLKGERFLGVGDIKSSVKKMLTDIPVQDLKKCFEQWPKHWEHCKELEGDYFEKF